METNTFINLRRVYPPVTESERVDWLSKYFKNEAPGWLAIDVYWAQGHIEAGRSLREAIDAELAADALQQDIA